MPMCASIAADFGPMLRNASDGIRDEDDDGDEGDDKRGMRSL
jgi:hypothetical protein